MPFGLIVVVVFALAGASVARRRGWPVVVGAAAAGLVPPVGIAACLMFVADRLRDAVAAQTGSTGPAGRADRPTPSTRPRREAGPARSSRAPRPPDPLPEMLESGSVFRALRTHGPMTEPELLAALVDPPTEVRYQLRELERHAAVATRHGKYVAR